MRLRLCLMLSNLLNNTKTNCILDIVDAVPVHISFFSHQVGDDVVYENR